MSSYERDATGETETVVVIGAGPAGLTAAYELQERSHAHAPLVLEASGQVGGISRTESHDGYRFDIGGHRFFTKVAEVERMWHDVLGDDFIRVRRQSRIYYRGKFFSYPIKAFDALMKIGPYEGFRIMLSYAKWRLFPHRQEETFERWVINRFGGRLYMHFFRSYTQKVWGIAPSEISADWAAQRIKNLSLYKAVRQAVTGANDTASLIEEFDYPRLGPGMMWEKVQETVTRRGGEVRLNSWVRRVLWHGARVTGVEVETGTAEGARTRYRIGADHVVNSMGLRDLVAAMDPPAPPEVRAAADKLRYRDFLIVTLVLDHPDPFPDNWIYIHDSAVKVGRIQNFRAWSREMLPRPDRASIGMEYFCQEGDGLWETADDDLIAEAAAELETLGLAAARSAVGGYVIRQPKAYPVYDGDYKGALDVIAAWIEGFENLQTVGRNGLHRYNNQDHSMLSAMLAARNLLGERHDVWNVNVERSYHEEFMVEKQQTRSGADGGQQAA